MDPDTSRKVKDLLTLMDDISSDIDVNKELDGIKERIQALEEKVGELTVQFSRIEKTHQEKLKQVKSIKKDLETLFPEK